MRREGFEGVQMNPPLFNWNKEIVAFTLLASEADSLFTQNICIEPN